jgi:hypothetical protein
MLQSFGLRVITAVAGTQKQPILVTSCTMYNDEAKTKFHVFMH